MDWFVFILASLAVFRLSELIALDAGPFRVFAWWRGLFKRRPILHELFTCFYCVSGYVSLGVCLVLRQAPVSWLIYWPALWGMAAVVFRTVRVRKD